jgi:uncharacterized membrane protein required for colicin V production
MISLFLILVLGITAGLFYREGLWSALVAVINVLFAAAVATAWYEWLAELIAGAVPEAGYIADFFCIWVLFALVLAGTSELTNRVSRTRVMFAPLVDRIGGPVVGLVVGWIFICFTATTLHLAPVTRDLIQPTPDARVLGILAPDRKWLHFIRTATRLGPFARPGENDANVFDKDADFILRYADRRKKLEGEGSLWAKP